MFGFDWWPVQAEARARKMPGRPVIGFPARRVCTAGLGLASGRHVQQYKNPDPPLVWAT